MALSRVIKTGDGTTTQFVVDFALGYLDQSDVTCRVGDEVDGAGNPVHRTITFISDTLLQISGTPPGAGVRVIFDRTVEKEDTIVHFADGDILDEENLDLSFKQILMAVHEVLDGRISALDNELDMGGFRVVNLGEPVDANDAATKKYVNENNSSTMAAAAATSAAAAATSAAAAATSANTATVSENAANEAANKAASSASAAATSAAAAATSAGNALTQANRAQSIADNFTVADLSVTNAKLASNAVTNAKIADGTIDPMKKISKTGTTAAPNLLGKYLADRNDVRDWLQDVPYSSTTAAQKIQAAADAFGNGTNLAMLHLPSGLIVPDRSLMLPRGFGMKGEGRQSDLRNYNGSTAGVSHLLTGTVFDFRASNIASGIWTDVNGSDNNTTVGISFLGESITLEDMTITCPDTADYISTGIHVPSTSKHKVRNVDVRGGFRLGAVLLDGTWSYANDLPFTRSQIAAKLVANGGWLNQAIYDYGCTDILFDGCRFHGVYAVRAIGSNRTSYGSYSSWVWGQNGLSDTVFRNCQLYQRGDSAARLAGAALVEASWKVDLNTNAQGFTFDSCRFDIAGKYMLNLDRIDDFSVTGGRTFAETSGAWASANSQYGTILTSANTGEVVLEGEIYAQIQPVGGSAIDIRDMQYRNDGGKKVHSHLHNSNQRGSYSTPWMWAYGADSGMATTLLSWDSAKSFKFIGMDGNAINSVATIGLTATFIRSLTTDTTANSANMYVNPTNGNLSRSTSSMRYKERVSDLPQELLDAYMETTAFLYKSKGSSDPDHYLYIGMSAEEFHDKGLKYLVHYGDYVTGPLPEGQEKRSRVVEGLQYERLIAVQHEVLKQMQAKLDDLEDQLSEIKEKLAS